MFLNRICALFTRTSQKTTQEQVVYSPDLFVEIAKDKLRRHEGLRYLPYTDTTGHKSIAYGRNLDDNPYPKEVIDYLSHERSKGVIEGEEVTLAACEYLLSLDVESSKASAVRIFGIGFFSWTDTRKAAILNMIYNLGETRFRKFRYTIESLKKKDWALAADHAKNSLWYKQVKSRGVEIVKDIREG
jgi:lysozyme